MEGPASTSDGQVNSSQQMYELFLIIQTCRQYLHNSNNDRHVLKLRKSIEPRQYLYNGNNECIVTNGIRTDYQPEQGSLSIWPAMTCNPMEYNVDNDS